MNPHSLATPFHATCTSKMGRGLTAVVDERLRVHGLERLRTIDAGHDFDQHQCAEMIAEKGAAMAREDARA